MAFRGPVFFAAVFFADAFRVDVTFLGAAPLTAALADAAFLTTQVYFDDALLDEIIATQPLYNTRGERDTRNPKDLCIAEDQLAEFTLQTERRSDGAMLAWKTVILRSSAATELCDANSQCQQEILKNGSKEDDIPPLPLPSICSATGR